MKQFSDELTPVGGLQAIGGDSAPITPTELHHATNNVVTLSQSTAAVPPMYGNSPGSFPQNQVHPASSYKSRDIGEDAPNRLPLYIGGGAAVAALAGLSLLLIPTAPVEAPKDWLPFTAADQSFACEVPKSWEVIPMGKASSANENSIGDGVLAKKGDAMVEVTVSSIGGLLTGQLLFGDETIPSGVFHSRAAPIYKAHGKQFKKKFSQFKETKITPLMQQYPKMTNVVMGQTEKDLVADIRWSEYTATGNRFGFGGKRHGYRMAVGGNQYIVNVVCECSERDWVKLKPAFERTIASVNETRKPAPGMIGVPGGASLPMGGNVPGFGGSGLVQGQ